MKENNIDSFLDHDYAKWLFNVARCFRIVSEHMPEFTQRFFSLNQDESWVINYLRLLYNEDRMLTAKHETVDAKLAFWHAKSVEEVRTIIVNLFELTRFSFGNDKKCEMKSKRLKAMRRRLLKKRT